MLRFKRSISIYRPMRQWIKEDKYSTIITLAYNTITNILCIKKTNGWLLSWYINIKHNKEKPTPGVDAPVIRFFLYKDASCEWDGKTSRATGHAQTNSAVKLVVEGERIASVGSRAFSHIKSITCTHRAVTTYEYEIRTWVIFPHL
jgi:hypothetical protein